MSQKRISGGKVRLRKDKMKGSPARRTSVRMKEVL